MPLVSDTQPLTRRETGLAWRRYWAKHGQRGLPVGRDGYFIHNLPSEWPPER